MCVKDWRGCWRKGGYLQGRRAERVPNTDQGARGEAGGAACLGDVGGESGEVDGEVGRGCAFGEVVQEELEHVAGVVLPVDWRE